MKGVNLTHLDDHLYHCYLDFSVDHYTTQTTEKHNTVMCWKVSLDLSALNMEVLMVVVVNVMTKTKKVKGEGLGRIIIFDSI